MSSSCACTVSDPQINSSALEVASSSSERGSYLGSTVVPLILPSDVSGGDVVLLMQKLKGYFELVERRREEDIACILALNAELRDRVTQLEQSNSQMRESGLAFAFENEYLRKEVEKIRRIHLEESTIRKIKKIANEAASIRSDGAILGAFLGFYASIIGGVAGGPLAGLFSFTLPTLLGSKIDEITKIVNVKEYERFLFDTWKGYLDEHPDQYEKASAFAEQKLYEKIKLTPK